MGNGMVVIDNNNKEMVNSIWETDCKLLKEAVDGKPEDGSDVSTLQSSLEEVVKLRKIVNAVCKGFDKLNLKDDEAPAAPTEILSSEEDEPAPGYVM